MYPTNRYYVSIMQVLGTTSHTVTDKGGIDIFQDEEKISMIWILINSAQGGFVRGDVVYEVKNPKKRDLTLYDKIEKTRKTKKQRFYLLKDV